MEYDCNRLDLRRFLLDAFHSNGLPVLSLVVAILPLRQGLSPIPRTYMIELGQNYFRSERCLNLFANLPYNANDFPFRALTAVFCVSGTTLLALHPTFHSGRGQRFFEE